MPEQTPRPPAPRRAGSRHLQVLGHAERGIDARDLKLAADAGAGDSKRRPVGDVRAGGADAPGRRRERTRHDIEEGRLAAAVGADDAAQLAGLENEVQPVERDHAAKVLGNAPRSPGSAASFRPFDRKSGAGRDPPPAMPGKRPRSPPRCSGRKPQHYASHWLLAVTRPISFWISRTPPFVSTISTLTSVCRSEARRCTSPLPDIRV